MTTLHAVPDQREAEPGPDRAAEEHVLGAAMLTDGASLDDCPLRPTDFGWPPYGELWTLLQGMREARERIDATTVRARLADRPIPSVDWQVLHRLIAGVPSPASAGWYAAIVRDAADRRALTQLGMRLQVAASLRDARDARQAAVELLREQDERDVGGVAPTVGESYAAFITGLESGEPVGPTLPWPDLTHYLGGLRPGCLYVIGARPGVGKSVLGMNLAWHVAVKHQTPVLLHSLEMSAGELTGRLIAAVGPVDYRRIANRTAGEREWDRIVAVQQQVCEAPLRIDDRTGLRAADLVKSVRLHAPVGLLVVDYLQLLRPSDSRLPREQQVAEISRELKLLAKEAGLPVVLLAQLNRQVEHRADRRPVLSDLRESGAIEQDADVVLLLHRDMDGEGPGEVEVIVAKNRHGATGIVPLRWEGHHMRAVSTVRA